MKTDVILLLYNRPVYSLAVLDSLIANGVSHVRAFMDFDDTPEVAEKQEHLLQGIEARGQIEMHLHRHTRRLGLAGSVRFALDATLADADAAILLEDDCVVQPGGLEFFYQGLERLHNRVDIWSVSWALEHYLTNTFAVYPSGSVIKNIGFDGTGQHCLASGVFETADAAPARGWDGTTWGHRAENDEILKRFMDRHGKTIYPGP